MKNVFKGFKFGMLLQLAVGPMCLMVFNTASSNGFISGFVLVIAISIVDSIYIALSALGASKILLNKSIQTALKLFGSLVLAVFGLNIMLGSLGYSILPSVSLFSTNNVQNLFLQGILLTASNPLTIIFWSGVFAAQVVENSFSKNQLIQFGGGCVLSTLCFLSFVSAMGSIANVFLSQKIIIILNFVVGIVLIVFGVKLLLKKST